MQVDVNRLDPKPEDYYLLCSDGLSSMINDDKILSTVLASRDLDNWVRVVRRKLPQFAALPPSGQACPA